MSILILEDDVLVAQLLETIVNGLYPRHTVVNVATVSEAMAAWAPGTFELVICDWNLPDGSGLQFIKHVRERDARVLIVLETGRADRQSVLTAAHYRVNCFISKPFSVEYVHQKLALLLPPESVDAVELPDIAFLMKEAIDKGIQLPAAISTAEVIELQGREQSLLTSQLVERWRNETGLVARLLDVANSSSYKRSGTAVKTLGEAVQTLGIRASLDQALGLSLHLGGVLKDPRFKVKATEYAGLAERTAGQAQVMAQKLKVDARLCFTAGLLSRIGELAVLNVLQQFVHAGGEVADAELEQHLKTWSAPLGNTLKVQWKLPLDLRTLVGAVHYVPADSVKQVTLMMRAAALVANGQSRSQDCQKLLRRAGLDPEVFTERLEAPSESGETEGQS